MIWNLRPADDGERVLSGAKKLEVAEAMSSIPSADLQEGTARRGDGCFPGEVVKALLPIQHRRLVRYLKNIW